MKRLVLFLLYSLASCKALPKETHLSFLQDGLYAGYKPGLLGRFNVFVVVKDSVAYTEEISERSGNIMINDYAFDTLYRKDDSTFSGGKFSLKRRNNKLFLENNNQQKGKHSYTELIPADQKIRSVWNVRHNRLQLFEMEDRHKKTTSNRTFTENEQKVFRDAYIELRKMTDMEQDKFQDTLRKFEDKYLNNR